MKKCRMCGTTDKNDFYKSQKYLCKKCKKVYEKERYKVYRLIRPKKIVRMPQYLNSKEYSEEMVNFERAFNYLLKKGWFHYLRPLNYKTRVGKTPEEKLAILLTALNDRARQEKNEMGGY